MTQFVNGEADVLLSTTIIESGLDIPNANTIIIDRADRFGLSDLYQLRGRVGRYKHQAYAYLLLPRHAGLLSDARKRISALKQYSTLGSGFKIAMRDLEIRGAGNLLGAEQSGHITAVGFELYCQLLKQSVSLKGKKTGRRGGGGLGFGFSGFGSEEGARRGPRGNGAGGGGEGGGGEGGVDFDNGFGGRAEDVASAAKIKGSPPGRLGVYRKIAPIHGQGHGRSAAAGIARPFRAVAGRSRAADSGDAAQSARGGKASDVDRDSRRQADADAESGLYHGGRKISAAGQKRGQGPFAGDQESSPGAAGING